MVLLFCMMKQFLAEKLVVFVEHSFKEDDSTEFLNIEVSFYFKEFGKN